MFTTSKAPASLKSSVATARPPLSTALPSATLLTAVAIEEKAALKLASEPAVDPAVAASLANVLTVVITCDATCSAFRASAAFAPSANGLKFKISIPPRPSASATSAAETPCEDNSCTTVVVGVTTLAPAGALNVTLDNICEVDESTALMVSPVAPASVITTIGPVSPFVAME